MFITGSHEQLASSLESIAAAFAVFQVDRSDRRIVLVSANSLFEEVTSRPIIESIGATQGELLPRHVKKPFRACILRCLDTQTSQDDEIVVERDAASRWWRLVVTPILGTDAGTQRLMVTLIDISDKKVLERKLATSHERFEAVVEAAYDGIVTIDETQSIKLMNEAARNIFRVGDENMEGVSLMRFIPPRLSTRNM